MVTLGIAQNFDSLNVALDNLVRGCENILFFRNGVNAPPKASDMGHFSQQQAQKFQIELIETQYKFHHQSVVFLWNKGRNRIPGKCLLMYTAVEEP